MNDLQTPLSLADQLMAKGDYGAAGTLLKKIIQQSPSLSAAWHKLGLVAQKKRENTKALEYFLQACKLEPRNLQHLTSLSSCYLALNKFQEAENCCRKALEIDSKNIEANFSLALIAQSSGRDELAIEQYEKTLALNFKHLGALNNLANVYKDRGQLEKAVYYYQKALEYNPGYAIIYNNLGNAYKNQGKIDEAIRVYQKALAIDPTLAEVRSSLLLALGYSNAHTPEQIFQEHLKWGELHAEPLYKPRTYPNAKDLARPLRVGYLSPDYREHSVAYFLDAIFEHHDPNQVEIYAYANNTKEDAYTQKLKSAATVWRNVAALPDEALDELIRLDKIDILIDLAGHTSRHRLGVFALKPAPLEITYLGYLNTTGLRAIDYLITDEQASPSGTSEKYYSENLLRLPKGFLCFKPPKEAPEVTRLPALENGYITFGSFNYYLAKITPQMVGLWAQLLLEVPGSKLLLKSGSFNDPSTCEEFYRQFEAKSIGRERLILMSWFPNKKEHLAKYSLVDIALDSYPYNGVTTICEALWMGLPVVSLTGQTHASRMGKSILAQVGLPELAVDCEAAYIAKAKSLATNLAQLAELRTNMRSRLQNSSLLDGPGFTKELEKAYRQIWVTWCEKP